MKRKNGEGWSAETLVGVVGIVICATGFFVGLLLPLPGLKLSSCIAWDAVDFVVYGFEGDRDVRRDDAALIDALAGLELRRVEAIPAGAVRHVDFGIYDEWELVGTALLWHEPDMVRWYVTVNDGDRVHCGVYAVEGVGVVFDVLKGDG